MEKFEYADKHITDKQILVAIPSFVISTGILSLPQSLASDSLGSDGWISLLIGGLFAVSLTWAIAKLTSSFPNQSFLSFASLIVTKPVAIVLTFLFSIISLNVTAMQIREIADISKHYLLRETPVEVISLTFFLLIIYAVSSSRIGIFRLNTLFLPFILIIAIVIILFNIHLFNFGYLSPSFETGLNGYLYGVEHSMLSYAGFGLLWFYISLVKKPQKTPKMAAAGMLIPIILYILLYLACILVFGASVTSNLQYPTIELAKIVEIPGGILERFESIFFVIWVMAIFNTTTMSLDIAVFALNSIFKNISKIKITLFLAPIAYAIGMFPHNIIQVNALSRLVSFSTTSYSIFILILLFTIAKIRRVI